MTGRAGQRQASGAVAILLGAAAWGSTGTAAHFAPAGASAASIGAARIAVGGVLLVGDRGQHRPAAARPSGNCWPGERLTALP